MKKLILSRKGFDSSQQGGGGPSPILPDGTLLSLPIPSNDKVKYSHLNHPQFGSYQKIIDSLGLKPSLRTCHLDPDLNSRLLQRRKGWRASLGQAGAAESHLRKYAVGPGDLFLFFGWFRQTEISENGELSWSRADSADRHILFGYLEVDYKLVPGQDRVPHWLQGHPHLAQTRVSQPLNAIYIARKSSEIAKGAKGSGTFAIHKDLVLTIPGKTRSWWSLPRSIFSEVDITYHANAWQKDGFRCVGRGQEFIMPMTTKIKNWAKRKMKHAY